MNAVPKLKEGGQSPTLPDGFWPKRGSVTGSVGGDGAKRGLRRKDKAAPLDIKVGGGRYGGSPEFLTKGQFRRGAEGVTIYALAKGGRRDREKADGLEGECHLRLKKRNRGYGQSTPTHPGVVPQAETRNLHIDSSKPPRAGGLLEGGREAGEGRGRRQRPQAM